MIKELKKRNGFTLVELIVVIAIIGILSAVLIPSISGYIERARESAAMQEVNIIATTTYQSWVIDMEDQHPGENLNLFDFYAYANDLELIKISAGAGMIPKTVADGYLNGFFYRASNGLYVEVTIGTVTTMEIVTQAVAEALFVDTPNYTIESPVDLAPIGVDDPAVVVTGEFHRDWNMPLLSVIGSIPGTGVLGWRLA